MRATRTKATPRFMEANRDLPEWSPTGRILARAAVRALLRSAAAAVSESGFGRAGFGLASPGRQLPGQLLDHCRDAGPPRPSDRGILGEVVQLELRRRRMAAACCGSASSHRRRSLRRAVSSGGRSVSSLSSFSVMTGRLFHALAGPAAAQGCDPACSAGARQPAELQQRRHDVDGLGRSRRGACPPARSRAPEDQRHVVQLAVDALAVEMRPCSRNSSPWSL